MNTEWTEFRLRDISEMAYGSMPPENIKAETGYPIYTGYRVAGYATKYNHVGKMLVVVARGVGGTGDVKISPKNSWITNLSIVLKLDEEKADKKFLCELLGFASLKAKLDTGAAQSQITINSLSSFKIRLPPLPTQQKIARILSAYDDLIENNLKRIKLLEEMAQITYEQWFVRMKFPGHENVLVDAEAGLPEGWKQAPITEVATVNRKSLTKKTEPETIKYIDISSVSTGQYEIPQSLDFSEAPSRARRTVKYGDTIFSTVRPNRKIYALILEDDPLLVASTGFATLTPKLNDSFSFVHLSVANQAFVDRAVAVAGGAAYPAVNQSDFENIEVTIPTPELISDFSEKFNQNFEVIGSLTKQNRRLKEARDILLPRLMTGLINVEGIELPNIKQEAA